MVSMLLMRLLYTLSAGFLCLTLEVMMYSSCWYIVTDAVRIRMKAGALQECEANAEVLHSDTMDQFRTFQMREQLLQSPSKVASQLLFQIPPHSQTMLIERPAVILVSNCVFIELLLF